MVQFGWSLVLPPPQETRLGKLTVPPILGRGAAVKLSIS